VDFEPVPLVTRSIWTFVWFAIVSVGTNDWWSWSSWSGFSLVAPLITLGGLVGMVLMWTLPLPRVRVFEHVSFVASLAAVTLTTAPILATAKFFNTDSAAFNQLATQLLVKGHNPYAATFRPSMLLLNQPADFWTYTLSGGHIDKVSYPAGSFVLQAPFQLLGIHHLGADWLDLLAWLVAAVILYAVSPSYAKWLSPLLLLASLFTFTFAHGGTDALFVPFMMLAALRWDDFVLHLGPMWSRWLGPVALGVACSIKQTPWFAVPFFVVGIALEAEHHGVPVVKTTLRYLSMIIAPFVAINLPFIIWSPSRWLHGTLLPLTQPLVPDGQGLVSLATHGLVRGVHTRDLQFAGGLLLLALLIAFVIWYPSLKRMWLFAVPIALFVPSRSLSSYLVDFIPAAFVAVLTTTRAEEPRSVHPRQKVLVAAVLVPVVAAVLFAVLAFTSPTLTIKVDHYSSTSDGQFIGPLTLTLSNNSSSIIHPHVMVVVGSGHPVGFWTARSSSNFVIQPYATVTTTFIAPKFMWAPKQYENWLIEVMTSSPAALSTSPAYSWPYDSH
jgi:uncharacterized membrane protein